MTDTPPSPPVPDTPPTVQSSPPATKLDQIQTFAGNLARPFAIAAAGASAAITPIVLAARIQAEKIDLTAAAIFVGAIFTGLVGLYTAKAWENRGQAAQTASVEIAKATTPTT